MAAHRRPLRRPLPRTRTAADMARAAVAQCLAAKAAGDHEMAALYAAQAATFTDTHLRTLR